MGAKEIAQIIAKIMEDEKETFKQMIEKEDWTAVENEIYLQLEMRYRPLI